MDTKLHPVISVRIFGAEKCFGPGVATLLEKVEALHSLRAAAASIGMAYSKAWTIVKNSENALGFKLLSTTTGGKHGGGATLTPEGAAFLQAYDEFCGKLNQYGDRLFTETFEVFLQNQ